MIVSGMSGTFDKTITSGLISSAARVANQPYLNSWATRRNGEYRANSPGRAISLIENDSGSLATREVAPFPVVNDLQY